MSEAARIQFQPVDYADLRPGDFFLIRRGDLSWLAFKGLKETGPTNLILSGPPLDEMPPISSWPAEITERLEGATYVRIPRRPEKTRTTNLQDTRPPASGEDGPAPTDGSELIIALPDPDGAASLVSLKTGTICRANRPVGLPPERGAYSVIDLTGLGKLPPG